MNTVLLGIFLYLLIQFVIGVAASRRIASEADYLLAGRRLGLALGAFSVFATWFGAETIVGAAGAIYDNGLAGGSADPFGYALCLILGGLILAMPLWRRRFTTFADLFRVRYSRGVERFAVLLMVPTSVIWAAAQIRAFGQVVSASSNIDVSVAITVAAVLVVLYTVIGGLLADAITDLVQGAALIVGLVVLFIVINGAAGGFSVTLAMVEPGQLRLFATEEQGWLEVAEEWAIPVFGSLLAVELISRMLACKSPETARGAMLLGGGIYLSVGLIPVFLGLIGPGLLPGLEDGEQIIPRLAQQHLSTMVYVLFAGALISAILSTVDSALLASASLISHNLLVPLRPDWGEGEKVWAARVGVIAMGCIAYVMALHAGGIYELVETASAFGSAGIFVVGLFGLFSRLGGVASAYAALAVGMIVWLAGEYVLAWSTPYLIALGSALAVYLGTALLERAYAAGAQAAGREFS